MLHFESRHLLIEVSNSSASTFSTCAERRLGRSQRQQQEHYDFYVGADYFQPTWMKIANFTLHLWMQHKCCTHTVSVYNMCIVSNCNDLCILQHVHCIYKMFANILAFRSPLALLCVSLIPVKHQQLSFEGRIEARLYDMKGKRHQRFALHLENNIQIIPQNQNATCTKNCVSLYEFMRSFDIISSNSSI